ncbi:MAG TPA: hypothetical protein VMD56_06835 [Steroidobacteraceae bacterium]|nr:hypothetical protein [Steroidobacteraceae bacterium]
MKGSAPREYLLEALRNAEPAGKPHRLGGLLKALPWTAEKRRARRVRADMFSGRNSYLETTGWLRSRREKAAVDPSGRPVPWWTYPSAQFIAPRIHRAMRVFEYGSGASTLWWAARVSAVVACEYDATWYRRMSGIVPANVTLVHVPDSANFPRQILSCDEPFDVVTIDAEERVECARACVRAMRPDGVIVWDNSDRAKYQEGFDFLRDLKFRRLDFFGLGPIDVTGWSTSVFYRTENCLGI